MAVSPEPCLVGQSLLVDERRDSVTSLSGDDSETHDLSVDSGNCNTDALDLTFAYGSEEEVTSDNEDALARINACADKLLSLSKQFRKNVTLGASYHDVLLCGNGTSTNNNTVTVNNNARYCVDDLSVCSDVISDELDASSSSPCMSPPQGSINAGTFTFDTKVSGFVVADLLDEELTEVTDIHALSLFDHKIAMLQSRLVTIVERISLRRSELSNKRIASQDITKDIPAPTHAHLSTPDIVPATWSQFPPLTAKRAPRNIATRRNDF